ncbi:hypothetical protein ACFLRP_00525 [Bacteroidota bacterium]
MGKKILLISLALSLVLIAVAPITTMAKRWSPPERPNIERFSVVLTPTSIDNTVIGTTWPVRDTVDTNVWPIVDLVDGTPTVVGWVVDGRSIYGGVTGNIGGNFSFTYGGVLDTLQSGSIQGIVAIQTARGVVYLAARGTSEAEVLAVYSFPEIQGWVAAAGLPSVGVFFAQMYNNPDLAPLPDEVLVTMYGSVLPLLPKTLSAEFSGTVRVDAGTGAFSSVKGTGKYKPAGGNPLTLQVWPSQHVYAIDGAIQMTGSYSKRPLKGVFKFDRDKARDVIKKWREKRDKD